MNQTHQHEASGFGRVVLINSCNFDAYLKFRPSPWKAVLVFEITTMVVSIGAALLMQVNEHSVFWEYGLPLLILVFGLIGFLLLWYRRQQVRQVERTRQLREELLRDLHDEMGSKLAVVNLYSALLQDQLSPGDREKTKPILNKLLGASTALYHSMQDLQWMLDPEKDQLRHLLQELRAFGQELLSPQDTLFQENIALSEEQLGQVLPIHHKKNLLFLFKEAIHNTVKHAGALEAGLQVWSTPDRLHICWWDKGGPQRAERLSENGYGLKNMEVRAAKLGAALDVQRTTNGTQVHLQWPVEAFLREEKSVS